MESRSRGPKACTTCAKAKAKCNPGPSPSKCERCHRLLKQCNSQIPAPPRPRKAVARPARVAELERRLEQLTTRLETLQPPLPPGVQHQSPEEQGPPPPPPPPPIPPSTRVTSVAAAAAEYHSAISRREPRNGRIGIEERCGFPDHLFPSEKHTPAASAACTWPATPESSNDGRDGQQQGFGNRPAMGVLPPTPHTESRSPSDPAREEPPARTAQGSYEWPTGDEAEALLDHMKATHRMGMAFPFVTWPDDMSAAELRRTRPLAWKGATLVALQLEGPRQMALGHLLLSEVGLACIGRPAKSLDLVQGILLLIAAYHYNINSFQMGNLLFLARSLIINLGLAEPPGAAGGVPTALGAQAGGVMGYGGQQQTEHSLEEMRTMAGVYYLVSTVFTTNHRPDTLLSTPYLDHCLEVLLTRRERTEDELLVYMVQIQQLAQKISRHITAASLQQLGGSTPFIVRSYQQQIDTFVRALPRWLADNRVLKLHIHVAEMLLYEPFISTQAATTLPPTERLQMLWCCLDAATKFMGVRDDCSALQNYRPAGRASALLTPNSLASAGSIGQTPSSSSPSSDSYKTLSPMVVALAAAAPPGRDAENDAREGAATASDEYSGSLWGPMAAFDFVYGFLVMLRLICLDAPGWDLRMVRSRARFGALMERKAADLAQLGELRTGTKISPNPKPDDDPFFRLSRRMLAIKAAISRELDRAGVAPGGGGLGVSGIDGEVRGADDVLAAATKDLDKAEARSVGSAQQHPAASVGGGSAAADVAVGPGVAAAGEEVASRDEAVMTGEAESAYYGVQQQQQQQPNLLSIQELGAMDMWHDLMTPDMFMGWSGDFDYGNGPAPMEWSAL